MIAAYAARQTVVPDAAVTTYLVNAADPRGSVVETSQACNALIHDCTGQTVNQQKLAAGLCRIAVPLGSCARIHKEN